MNLDPIKVAACVVNQSLVNGADGGNTQDARCNDAAFASAHPDICGAKSYLIIKPSSALIMRLSGVAYTVFEYANGIESQVTDSLHFTSSNPDIFLIGASSGSGTGLAKGSSVITVTRNGLTASASVTVLDSTIGCDQTAVKSLVLLDNSSSSSLAFGGIYQSRLDFAKAAAHKWSDKLILLNGEPKDGIKIWSFAETPNDISSDYLGDTDALDVAIDSIIQRVNKTDIFDTLNAAILDISLQTADEKVILLLSDGEQTTSADVQPILNSAAAFKAAGGIIVVVGLRASGNGFDLLERIATGGFFMNATSQTAADVLNGLGFLKSAVCLGTCAVVGDEYVNQAQLDYSSFKNWEVIVGQVDLIGNGEYDYLPGNGLYVDMIGSHGYTRDNTIRSIDQFALTSGIEYTISFKVAGNNRADVGNQSLKVYLRDPSAPTTDANIFEHTVSPVWDSDFQRYTFTFVSPITANAKIYFQQVLATLTADSPFGNLLDDIKLTNSSLTVLLDDNFDTENPVYIPPACGLGTILVPTANIPCPPTAVKLYVPNEDYTIAVAAGSSDASMTITLTVINPLAGFVEMDAFYIFYSHGAYASTPAVTIQSATSIAPSAWFITASQEDSFAISVTSAGVISIPAGTYVFNITTNAVLEPGNCYTEGFVAGYAGCYSDSCSQQAAIGPQNQDPSPLPDIENPGSGIQLFTSSKNFCASCLASNVNISPDSLVPLMTKDDAPSGLASANSELGYPDSDAHNAFDGEDDTAWFGFSGIAPQWLQYQFPTAQTVVQYSVKVLAAPITALAGELLYPISWDFQASNDGVTWTTLDSRETPFWSPGEEKRYLVANTTAYKYFRLYYGGSEVYGLGEICKFGLYSAASTEVCKTATATSFISQADADSKALAAATLAANSALNCIHVYTSTQSYTVDCPLGNGQSVTKTATDTSFISQADADAVALADAKAQAQAASTCNASNNTQAITINDRTGATAAKATPYPSIQNVSGQTGVITKVTVAIKKLSHTRPTDVFALLVHPNGVTTCLLMANCGNAIAATNVDLVFDQAAGSFLPIGTGPLVSGSFKPTQSATSVAPLPAPVVANSGLYGTSLNVFNGLAKTGNWALYVLDVAQLDSGNIAQGFTVTVI